MGYTSSTDINGLGVIVRKTSENRLFSNFGLGGYLYITPENLVRFDVENRMKLNWKYFRLY